MPYGVPVVLPTWGQSLGKGLDDSFDSIVEGMNQKYTRGRQDLQFQMQTGYDPKDLAAGKAIQDGMNDGSVPSAIVPGPGGTAGTRQPLNTADQGQWGEFQNFQQAMRGMRNSQMVGHYADAQEKLAHARYFDSLAGGGPGDPNDPTELAANAMIRYNQTGGKEGMPASMLGTLYGRGEQRKLIVNRVLQKDPNFDFGGSAVGQAQRLEEAKYNSSAAVQTPLGNIETARGNLQDLLNLANQLPSEYRGLKHADLMLKRQDDPLVARYDALRTIVSEETGKVLSGSGMLSDAKMAAAGDVFHADSTPEQTMSAADAVDIAFARKARSLRYRDVNRNDAITPPPVSANGAPASASPSAPQDPRQVGRTPLPSPSLLLHPSSRAPGQNKTPETGSPLDAAAQRFNQIRAQNPKMAKLDIYRQLHDEGYSH